MNKYLKLYSSCIPVKGTSRSVICDLQRSNVFFIPNGLFDLFSDQHAFCIEEAAEQLDNDSKMILEEYAAFLLDTELAFFVQEDQLQNFPSLNTDWLFPAQISNCIIDGDREIGYLNPALLGQLEMLCCNHIQLRFFNTPSVDHLLDLLHLLVPSQIKSIDLVLPYQPLFSNNQEVLKFMDDYRKIRDLILYAAPTNEILKSEDYWTGSVYLSTEPVLNSLHCGVIESSQFAINIGHYTEALHHNTCINRKISIDTHGDIKNCPSMKNSFGNLKNTTLAEAIEIPGFKKHWNITKDEITGCKACEFRYICTDCRAFIEHPDEVLSKPLKCGYDPITCEWEEWSTNPLKQAAIVHYGLPFGK